jgi:hypothetical protein
LTFHREIWYNNYNLKGRYFNRKEGKKSKTPGESTTIFCLYSKAGRGCF